MAGECFSTGSRSLNGLGRAQPAAEAMQTTPSFDDDVLADRAGLMEKLTERATRWGLGWFQPGCFLQEQSEEEILAGEEPKVKPNIFGP